MFSSRMDEKELRSRLDNRNGDRGVETDYEKIRGEMKKEKRERNLTLNYCVN